MKELNSIVSVSGWAGGSTADFNQPYLPGSVAVAAFEDGVFYTNGGWDEGGNEVTVVDLDTPQLRNGGGNTHGWGSNGGIAIAVNSLYVYSSVILTNEGGGLVTMESNSGVWPPFESDTTSSGTTLVWSHAWVCVLRKNKSDMSIAPITYDYTALQNGFYDASSSSVEVGEYINELALNRTIGAGLGYPNVVISQYYDYLDGAQTNINAGIAGLAATDELLYISDPYNSRILVLDANTFANIRTLTAVPSVGAIAIASDGNLWASFNGTVEKINSTTGEVITSIATGHVGVTGNIGVLDDGTLWVVDNGPAQRVVLFADNGNSTATQSGYYGNELGIYGNGGSISNPQNFSFIRSFGRSGDFSYVLWSPGNWGMIATKHNDTNGGAIVNKFYGLFFLDVPELTPDATMAYSAMHAFSVDTAQPPGQQLTHISTTFNPFVYPYDMRQILGVCSTYVRSFGGKTFVFSTAQLDGSWTVHEVVSNILRPCGAFINNPSGYSAATNSSLTGFSIWRPTGDGSAAPLASEWSQPPNDLNSLFVDGSSVGCGWNNNNGFHLNLSIDNDGTLWRTVYPCCYWIYDQYLLSDIPFPPPIWIQRIPCSGFDSYGNPQWLWSNATSENAPSVFTGYGDSPCSFHAEYDSINDVMYLSGFTAENPFLYSNGENNGDAWGMAGKEFHRYDNWLGINGTRTLRWVVVPPLIKPNYEVRSWHFAGNLLALGYMTPPLVRLYNLTTGEYLGDCVSDGETGINESWIDGSHEVRVFVLDDGTYRIFAEREIGMSCLMYDVTPVGATLSRTVLPVQNSSTELFVSPSGVMLGKQGDSSYVTLDLNGASGDMPAAGSGLAIRDVQIGTLGTLRFIGAAIGYKSASSSIFALLTIPS